MPLPYLRTVFEAHREYPDTMQRETGAIISHMFHRNGVPFKSFIGGGGPRGSVPVSSVG